MDVVFTLLDMFPDTGRIALSYLIIVNHTCLLPHFMKYCMLTLLIIFLAACHSSQTPGDRDNEPLTSEKDSLLISSGIDHIAGPAATALTFYDSILQKQQLSFAQIRAHTFIDSFYYTGNYNGQSTFTGDTVYVLRNNFKGVVIEHSGPNCLKKFLLVFDAANRAVCHAEVSSECDGEEGYDYSSTGYKMIDDSTFITIETIIPANAEEKQLPNEEIKTWWKITAAGRIEQVK
jgi:hypothetical protein